MKTSLLIAAAMALPLCSHAQTVTAPYAQWLVTKIMSAHSELQKMGIHVIPPGGQDDIIVACSVPSKIAKKSSPGDLAVEQSGKATVKTVTERSFYDLALPLMDATGHTIGLLVMEMRFAGAANAEESLQKASEIRNEVQRQIPSLGALFKAVPHSAPLALLRTAALPDITGDFDHFAVDLAGNRLYLSAEVHHSIEVFNLKTGEHLRSAPVATTPHTLAFVPETRQLLVADGGDGSCRILDGADLHEIKRIPLEPGPDAGFYDAQDRLFYIGNGGRAANSATSFISIISVDKQAEIGRVQVESSNLESMALDRAARLLYVNMRDKNSIGVVDLTTKRVRQIWAIPGMNLNTPMSFDAAHHRLFVAGRKPGKLNVVDTDGGKLIASLDCVEKADDMSFDPTERRIYVTGSGGVTVIHQDSPDAYSLVSQFQTNQGKTSVLVPALDRLYIAHTKTAEDNAALQMYQVN